MLIHAKLAALFLVLIPFIGVEAGQSVDTASRCGQWDTVKAGQYSLLLDQWGKADANSGSACASLTSLSGTIVAWKNTWTWTGGGSGVKSYTNIQLNNGLNKKLSAIKSMPATWKWSQTTSGTVVANVAYDLFTSTTVGGKDVNEVMIWLGNYNAGPISSAYNADGTPKAVASSVSLAGHSWNLYVGSNGANKVYSFLPSNGAAIKSFSGDLNLFLKYLTSKQGVSASQYLKTAQGGSEATSGSATLTR
ncbi:concanavalin A-like lectin/glucanase [Cyathus striatus]|nr:concanavalin A-like lectin/glucanase [Cyathus striatus]